MPTIDDRPPVPRGPSALLGLLAISGSLLYVLPACGDDSSSFEDDSSTTFFETDDTTFGDFTTTDFTTTTDPTPGTDTNVDSTTVSPPDTTTTTDPTNTGSETTNGGGPVTCDPDNAMFSGDGITQASLEIDFDAQTCTTVSGFSPLDQLIIDDFGDGGFGGSGSSGLTVLSVDGGDFTNEDGFYLLDNLITDSPITVDYEAMDGTTFSAQFTIDPMTSSLTDTSVDFN